VNIQRLNSNDITPALPDLIELLQDSVIGGASIGFLSPPADEEALAYWQEVGHALKTPYRIMLAAQKDEKIVGSVQLDLASRANGIHRAEVVKLMVHSSARRQGIAQGLLSAIEDEARIAKRTTLILDTRAGDPSEYLYLKMGYTRAGVIPEYAYSTDGSLSATVFMYKLLRS